MPNKCAIKQYFFFDFFWLIFNILENRCLQICKKKLTVLYQKKVNIERHTFSTFKKKNLKNCGGKKEREKNKSAFLSPLFKKPKREKKKFFCKKNFFFSLRRPRGRGLLREKTKIFLHKIFIFSLFGV
jgi:hypothetical protein